MTHKNSKMMKIAYCIYAVNHVVTDYYIDIIKEGMKKSGYNVKVVSSLNDIKDRSAPIIVSSAVQQLKLYLRGFRNFITWSQGAVPEESYMRNHSWLRWKIISMIDRFTFSRCKLLFVVSEYQKEFYEKKYRLDLSNNCYVMPCYNCEIEETCFKPADKYKNNIFVFAGSCKSVWQYFDETLLFYKKIEDKYGDKVFFRLLTPDIEYAKEKIKNVGIRYYDIDCVKPSELPRKLSSCKFGLLLRENNVVNNVATPTKLSTYMSCGLIPIVSDSIKDFAKSMKNRDYFVIVNSDNNITEVEKYIEKDINNNEVLEEFYKYWADHYNTQVHIDNISKLINQLL